MANSVSFQDSSLLECPPAEQEVGGHVCLGFSTEVDDVENCVQVSQIVVTLT
jgi:hypothetical protein